MAVVGVVVSFDSLGTALDTWALKSPVLH